MSIAAAFREIAAILNREAAALEGITAPAPPPTPAPPAPTPTPPPAPPPFVPSSGFPPVINPADSAGRGTHSVDLADAMSVQLVIPQGWQGGFRISWVGKRDGPQSFSAEVRHGGDLVASTPWRPSAGNVRFVVGSMPLGAIFLRSGETYTFTLKTSEPAALWVEYE